MLINNSTHQRETLTEWPIRLTLSINANNFKKHDNIWVLSVNWTFEAIISKIIFHQNMKSYLYGFTFKFKSWKICKTYCLNINAILFYCTRIIFHRGIHSGLSHLRERKFRLTSFVISTPLGVYFLLISTFSVLFLFCFVFSVFCFCFVLFVCLFVCLLSVFSNNDQSKALCFSFRDRCLIRQLLYNVRDILILFDGT